MLSRNVSLLRKGDNERREEFARTMLGKMDTDPHFIDSMKNFNWLIALFHLALRFLWKFEEQWLKNQKRKYEV